MGRVFLASERRQGYCYIGNLLRASGRAVRPYRRPRHNMGNGVYNVNSPDVDIDNTAPLSFGHDTRQHQRRRGASHSIRARHTGVRHCEASRRLPAAGTGYPAGARVQAGMAEGSAQTWRERGHRQHIGRHRYPIGRHIVGQGQAGCIGSASGVVVAPDSPVAPTPPDPPWGPHGGGVSIREIRLIFFWVRPCPLSPCLNWDCSQKKLRQIFPDVSAPGYFTSGGAVHYYRGEGHCIRADM